MDPDVSRSALSDGSPSAPFIRVRVPRLPCRGRGRNNVFDESDLVDPLEGFPFLDSDRLVRSTSRRLDRRSRSDTELMDLDPRFVVQFNPAVDSAELEHNLKFDTSVPLHIRNRVVDLVKEFWCLFRRPSFLTERTFLSEVAMEGLKCETFGKTHKIIICFYY